jgi:hypothetical protein
MLDAQIWRAANPIEMDNTLEMVAFLRVTIISTMKHHRANQIVGITMAAVYGE